MTPQAFYALLAAKRGWHVFPVQPGSKLPLNTTRGRLKWYDAATADLDAVHRTWIARPQANVGICVAKSGLIVVDCDVKEGVDGRETLWRLVDQLGGDPDEFAATYSVHTPSGGCHFYFSFPGHLKASQAPLAVGVDIRSNGGTYGGYVLGAGSVLNQGGEPGWYVPVWRGTTAVLPCPGWLRAQVTHNPPIPPRRPTRDDFARPPSLSDAGLKRFVRNATPGGRNDALFWAAAVKCEEDPNLTEDDLYEAFAGDAQIAGLDDREIVSTLRSAHRKAHRRAP